MVMQEDDSFGKVIYMSHVQGPEKVNSTHAKTMHAGAVNRGVTIT
jgi:hypothetical protein